MTADKFQISFKSDICKVKDVVRDALRFVESNVSRCDNEACAELRLICSELLLNAIIHGNNHDRAKNVYFELKIKRGEVYAIIEDEGDGFDYKRLISSFDTNDALYNENGRGIKLVLYLTDSFRFNLSGNQVRFQKRVSKYE